VTIINLPYTLLFKNVSLFLKEGFYTHQGCIYLINNSNTVKYFKNVPGELFYFSDLHMCILICLKVEKNG